MRLKKDYKIHTNLIVQVLQSIGFKTVTCSQGVIVSLNRQVSSMEVQTALEQEFSGIQFKVSQVGNSVLVKE